MSRLSSLALTPFLLSFSGLILAVPDDQPVEITQPPAVPPLEIPEEVLGGIGLHHLKFDREFDSPVTLATLPEGQGEQVIALQRGEFCAVRLDGSGQWRPFLDFRQRMAGITMFEEGVHGIAFHPQFETNRLFYLSYTQNEPRRTVISEMRATPGDMPTALPESERVLLEIQQPLADHWGGHIHFGPDGLLYIALGDGGLRNDPYRLAQNPWVLHGKILRLDINARTGKLPYGIPADNPFANDQLSRPEIYALGLRNPWGLSFDSQTGHLWCADVGQDLWEEINLIKKGANYGWSDRDGPAETAFHPGPLLANTATTDPVHAYTRLRGEGICIVGGLLYRGENMPALQGTFLFADWGFGTVWALEMDDLNERATRRLVVHRKPDAMKFNPTLLTSDAQGEPVLLSQEGNLYRLEYSEEIASQ
ncbi:quinoprotein glucose dehydrogenase [Prosthecobacter fusiformis]|uniref:Quinoprotein glucose dehydrogenase n=1 Tax=Prosthecobacter fusiformis TaxID=48464 RepID=A0A4R7S313_9BACT|nr:PQQ-dependent sugar dehydrogenase [Prosthecobacter fusiformis]TDU72790.1 quinoprotein glucose dehydrogenase [Prosthecobacter fusiformis]